MSARATKAPPVPAADPQLDPNGLLWTYAADRRLYLIVPATGLMLAMQPGVSAALMEQSVFFDEPLQRTMRSIAPIVDTIYNQEMAHTVRDYHRDLKGVDHHGDRFHALSPDLYFATHAVFTYSFMTFVDRFVMPLDDAAKERFYLDCKTWYLNYGVSARHMPETWAGFQDYWEDLCLHGLEDTPTARRIVNHIIGTPAKTPPGKMPRPLWILLRPLAGDGLRILATGSLPPEVRRTLGMRWSRTDQAAYNALAAASRRLGAITPAPVRESSRGRRTREQALAGADG